VSFIAADCPAAAESFGLQLMTRTDSLANFPLLGRVVPEQNDQNTREIILRPYRIGYQVLPAQNAVAIARIWHSARGEPEIPSRLEI